MYMTSNHAFERKSVLAETLPSEILQSYMHNIIKNTNENKNELFNTFILFSNIQLFLCIHQSSILNPQSSSSSSSSIINHQSSHTAFTNTQANTFRLAHTRITTLLIHQSLASEPLAFTHRFQFIRIRHQLNTAFHHQQQ